MLGSYKQKQGNETGSLISFLSHEALVLLKQMWLLTCFQNVCWVVI